MKWHSTKIEDIKPNPVNPRVIADGKFEKLVKSIQEFPRMLEIRPIVVNDDMVVLGGNMRLKACKEAGLKEVPVIAVSDLTEEEQKQFIIKDNVGFGEWDWELLHKDWDAEELEDWGLDVDFSKQKIENEGLTDDDEVPEIAEEPVSKVGDVWILGNHRVMCGDSCSVDDMDKLCPNELVDMWLTDPPYNVAYEGGTSDKLTIMNDSMSDDTFRQFLRDAYATADTKMKAGAVFYIWHADSEGYNFRGACKDVAWQVRQTLIWKKSSMVLGRQDYQWQHEPCLYGWKEGSSHLWSSDRKQTTILEFDRPSRNKEHPTMKPVELIAYQLQNNTKGDDLVLDSFGGSGSTLIASEKHGRRARLMELDPKYVDVIIRRWQDYTGGTATLETSGESFNSLEVGDKEAVE